MAMTKSQSFQWIQLLLIAAVFASGCVYGSYLEIVLASCSAMFFLVGFRLHAGTDEAEQKNQCKTIGLFMLFPALNVLIIGVFSFVFPYGALPIGMAIISVVICLIYLAFLLLKMVEVWKVHSLIGRFMRWLCAASMTIPFSLAVVRILDIFRVSDANLLSCMTISILGCIALLIAAYLMLIASYGYYTLRVSIVMLMAEIRKRRLLFVRLAIVRDTTFVLGKGTISLLSRSFFMFANALYSAGMGIARFFAIKMHEQSTRDQIKSYRAVGSIITFSSICYVLYAVRLFFGGSAGTYPIHVALMIALYTFFEFGVNIRDVIRLRKSSEIEAKALRAINLASTLLCFVLTQIAIMSFAAEGDNRFVNALSGVGFGGLAAAIGIYVLLDSRVYQREFAPN